MTTVSEEKFDRFANDFFQFLALRYNLKTDARIKVVPSNDGTWERTVPAQFRRATENPRQFQHIALTFDETNADRISEAEKRFSLSAAGFTAELAEQLANYDVLLIINFDQPIQTITGRPYLWNLLISHHCVHLVEILSNQRLINEPVTEHNYESKVALEHLNRFVGWITVDRFIERYVPCK